MGQKTFKIHGAFGSSDTVTAISAAAARKKGAQALGEPIVRVELVDDSVEDIAADEETEDAQDDDVPEEE